MLPDFPCSEFVEHNRSSYVDNGNTGNVSQKLGSTGDVKQNNNAPEDL